jgi:hypothetical protein
MNLHIRSIAAALCFAALAGCGSPGADIAFKAPNGWKSTPGMFGRFQMWIAGSGDSDRQVVMLVRGDQRTGTSETAALSGTRDLHDVKHDSIVLCGSQRADHFMATGEHRTNDKTMREAVEGVIASIGSSKYVAFYMRPAAMQPDAQAEAAIHSLCPLK